MADEIRPRLGRGLAALIGDASADLGPAEAPRPGQRKVPIEFLRPNPRNPRKVFDEEHLEELTESIRARGLIQPIVVRAVPRMPDLYEIIAGERRWRAAQRAGVHDVPIHLVEASDQEALELAIVENIQRADLNPIEEAGGFDQLMREFAYTQTDLAKVLGKSRGQYPAFAQPVAISQGQGRRGVTVSRSRPGIALRSRSRSRRCPDY